MKLEEIVLNSLRNGKNIEKIADISRKFHRMAKIPFKAKIRKNCPVFESGHQPNFFPYSGVWRKVFLLSRMGRLVESVPIFGFHDLNLCTTKLLFQNKVPFINKDGFMNIGIKMSKAWISFNLMEKPEEKKWENLVNEIKKLYGSTDLVDLITEEMWKSYEFGKSFSDVNAILFSRLCNLMGFDNVLFFRYSDVQKYGLFREEWLRIVPKLQKITDERPFWYRCECGGMTSTDRCPICGNICRVESIEDDFENLIPKAILRNMVFSEGLRTSLFVSGAGGSLKYGAIADDISIKLGLNRPATIAWVGEDRYIGSTHRKILDDLSKLFDLSADDMLNIDSFLSKVRKKRTELAKDGSRKAVGQYRYSNTLLNIAEKVFTVIPSFLDILINVGLEQTVSAWNEAITNAKITKSRFYIIESNIIYNCDPELYDVIRMVSKKANKIDPLRMFGGG